MKTLGLVGGLGVGATIHYYSELAAAHRAIGEDARILISHAETRQAIRFVEQKDWSGLARYLAGFLQQLADGGADIAAIPAITPHVCLAELEPLSPLPLVSILDAVQDAVRQRGLRRVALFGTRTAMESRIFGRLDGVAEVVPLASAETDLVHRIYMELVNRGAGSEHQREQLSRVAAAAIQREHLDAILLAGTDLLLVLNESNTPFPYLDCARVHIDAIMNGLGPGVA
ncbi:MAG: aspartate/glutamate racemase family protein [Bryobacteraceae bacterium]